MFEELERYKEKDIFEFKEGDSLSRVCNAPRHSSGIYLIYAEEIKDKNLIYIGISGREGANGEIIHRKDGIGGRIVNGKQFGDGRRRAWAKKMKEDGIKTIVVKWCITYGSNSNDFPRPIERNLLVSFEKKYGRLPSWNNEL